MNRLSMSASCMFRLMPVIFIVVPLITIFKEPRYWYFSAIFIATLIYLSFSADSKIFFRLHDVYMDNEKILVHLHFSREPEIHIPLNNAIRVDYLPFAQQIIGQFWFYHPQTSEKSFVYFWPTLSEAKCETSTLYTACIAAGDEREKSKNA